VVVGVPDEVVAVQAFARIAIQGCQPRRQRVAVLIIDAPEELGKGSRLVIGKVEGHDPMIW
jgi:hypothetical protein